MQQHDQAPARLTPSQRKTLEDVLSYAFEDPFWKPRVVTVTGFARHFDRIRREMLGRATATLVDAEDPPS